MLADALHRLRSRAAPGIHESGRLRWLSRPGLDPDAAVVRRAARQAVGRAERVELHADRLTARAAEHQIAADAGAAGLDRGRERQHVADVEVAVSALDADPLEQRRAVLHPGRAQGQQSADGAVRLELQPARLEDGGEARALGLGEGDLRRGHPADRLGVGGRVRLRRSRHLVELRLVDVRTRQRVERDIDAPHRAVANVEAPNLVVAQVLGADRAVADVLRADRLVFDLAAIDEARGDAPGDASKRQEQRQQRDDHGRRRPASEDAGHAGHSSIRIRVQAVEHARRARGAVRCGQALRCGQVPGGGEPPLSRRRRSLRTVCTTSIRRRAR